MTGVGDVDLGAPILGLSAPKSGNIQRKPKTGAHGAAWNIKRGARVIRLERATALKKKEKGRKMLLLFRYRVERA